MEKSSDRRTLREAHVAFITEMGEDSGKNRNENVLFAGMKQRSRA